MSIVLTMAAPPRFSFRRTLLSHGWCALPPFFLNPADNTLRRVLTVHDSTPVLCSISGTDSRLRVSVEAASLSVPERREIKRVVQEMFRLKEDLGEFYGMLRQYERYRWIIRARAGRLLRSPTVFEDIVKMICTTNCTWALTTVMVTNLCRHLGSRTATGESSFPTAGQMADVSEKFFRTKIRAGYRSPYLLAFARAVAEGSFDPEALRASAAPTEDIYRQLLDLPGVGPYAAQNMLKLLGRYDYLGLDSWVRGTYAELYHRGRQVSDRTIERQYRRFGKWRGLVFWLEMTRRWFNEKFPL